jgi:hypothetical protein
MIINRSFIEDLESIIEWPLIISHRILIGLVQDQHRINGIRQVISIGIDIQYLTLQV